MAEFQRKVSFDLDENLVNMLNQYSSKYECDINNVVDEALEDFFQQSDTIVNQLIRGYMDMAAINTEMSQAFSNCEVEADKKTIGFFNS